MFLTNLFSLYVRIVMEATKQNQAANDLTLPGHTF